MVSYQVRFIFCRGVAVGRTFFSAVACKVPKFVFGMVAAMGKI